jgi:hypothetical protein
MRTLDLLASDSSHQPFLYVFKESKVMEKYGFEIDLHIVGGAKAPTMAHRAKLALAGEIDFLSGLHHETYRREPKVKAFDSPRPSAEQLGRPASGAAGNQTVEDPQGQEDRLPFQSSCVSGNLRAVLQDCGFEAGRNQYGRDRRQFRQILNCR